MGLRDAGSGTPSPQVSCVNWERPPLWAASSPHWPLSQAGLSSVHNLPNLRWQTYRHPSGKGSEARGPHLPICLTSVTHRGSQGLTGAPALPQAGPEKQVPRPLEAFQDFYPTVGLPADMVAMLPKSGTPASSALPKPRPRQSPAPDKAPPCKSPALPKPRSAPIPESWEVPAGGSPVFQECVGPAGGGVGSGRGCSRPPRVPWHGEGLQEAGDSPSQPSLSGPSVFLQMCAPRGTGTHPEGSGDPVWPFPGRGQGSTSLPLSGAHVPAPLPSPLLRSARADPPASLVLPGYSCACSSPYTSPLPGEPLLIT